MWPSLQAPLSNEGRRLAQIGLPRRDTSSTRSSYAISIGESRAVSAAAGTVESRTEQASFRRSAAMVDGSGSSRTRPTLPAATRTMSRTSTCTISKRWRRRWSLAAQMAGWAMAQARGRSSRRPAASLCSNPRLLTLSARANAWRTRRTSTWYPTHSSSTGTGSESSGSVQMPTQAGSKRAVCLLSIQADASSCSRRADQLTTGTRATISTC